MPTPATKPTMKQPSFYKMRAQLLEQGRTNTLLARTDNMWATLKVYASGGENGLHMHPHEDHTFVVLQGKARYYDATAATPMWASTKGSCCRRARTTGSRRSARSRSFSCVSAAGSAATTRARG